MEDQRDRLEISFKGFRASAVGPLAVGGLLTLLGLYLVATFVGML